MNDNIESQLGQYSFKRNINSDLKIAVDLNLSHKELDEFDIVRVLSIDDQFNKERANSVKYRLHGTISSISPITGRKLVWDSLDDMFDESNKVGFASLTDYFNFYLCYPSEMIAITEGSDLYIRKAKVISKLEDMNLINCGFAVSTFNEKTWNYTLNESYNLGELKTEYNHRTVSGITTSDTLPVTEVFLMAHPKVAYKSKQFISDYKEVEGFSNDSVYGYDDTILSNTLEIAIKEAVKTYVKPTDYIENNTGINFEDIIYPVIIFLFKMLNLSISVHNVEVNKNQIKKYLGLSINTNFNKIDGVDSVSIGDNFMCDLVRFDKSNFDISTVDTQEYFFTKRLNLPDTEDTMDVISANTITYSANSINGVMIDFAYKLNPFIPIKIREYSNYVEVGNPSNMDYIPDYAINNDENNKVWRDLLDIGYVEFESGKGVDYSFINGSHYIYSHLLLQIKPDMDVNNSYKTYRSYFMTHEITHYSKNINRF
jgi:hypothetical protein